MAGAGTIARVSRPIEIDSSNDVIGFSEGGGPVVGAHIADGTYWWRGDGTAADMVKALQDALNTAGAWTYHCTLDVNGVLSVTANHAWSLLWATGGGACDADPSTFGFDALDYASSGGANAIVSPWQVRHGFFPGDIYSRESEEYVEEGSVSTRVGSRILTQWFEETVYRDVGWTALQQRKVFQAYEVRKQESFERWFRDGLAVNEPFEFCRDCVNAPGVYAQYQIRDADWIRLWFRALQQIPTVVRRYNLDLPMMKYDP